MERWYGTLQLVKTRPSFEWHFHMLGDHGLHRFSRFIQLFFCFFVAFVLQSGLAPCSLIFLVAWQLCFERLIIAGLSDGLAVVLCLSLSFSVIFFYSFALSYQSSSSNAEEIIKERERTQELAQIQAVHHPPVLLASNLLNVLCGFQNNPRVLKFDGTRGTRPKLQWPQEEDSIGTGALLLYSKDLKHFQWFQAGTKNRTCLET